ncbi:MULTISPECIES: homoserine kinase [Sphingomonas]|uniref:Homoserine kinase n=1 Tax=Sphingomonas lycopersici TaxID=2951807 RepID=A0AA42CS78_9SPHN|nr:MULTISPECIES: homoserine kinase [Sphingomonas]MCW6532946.1 homoserine kinase [Sphingomonas lycopersici]MCW6537470.1 homoserine kinase [Sphingomonas lycopersici]OJU23020.1 MAG: homoserine kinase [Sphingomonas sp. 66-10]
MAVYTQVSAEVLAAFLTRYDVGELVSAKGIAEGVENSNFLVETTRDRFILTLYEKRVAAADLPFFMALLDHLDAKGLPVPPAIKDRDGIEIQELEGRPACLIRFMPGVSLSHPTPAQALAAGSAMGEMHRAVADFAPTRENSMGVDTWRPLLDRCGRSLDQIAPGLYDDLAAALDHVEARWPRDTLDRVAIHADLFPDNVLMLGDTVTSLIDFYFACTDIRVYDLAVMHGAWAFDGAGRNYDAAVGEALIRGYERHFPLSAEERGLFATLASGACIRFALSRAWDWLNTPPDALVMRKDPLAYMRRLGHYHPALAMRVA